MSSYKKQIKSTATQLFFLDKQSYNDKMKELLLDTTKFEGRDIPP